MKKVYLFLKKINKGIIKVLVITITGIFYPKSLLCSAASEMELPNPLAGGESKLIGITVVVGQVITVLFGVIGIVSLIALVIGAYYYLTAAGNQEKIKKGTETIIWAVIGIVVAFGSYAILSFIIERLGG